MDVDLATLTIGFLLGVVFTSLLLRFSLGAMEEGERMKRQADLRARSEQEAKEVSSRPPRGGYQNRTMWDKPMRRDEEEGKGR